MNYLIDIRLVGLTKCQDRKRKLYGMEQIRGLFIDVLKEKFGNPPVLQVGIHC